MKYNKMDWGTMEAIINKLGGLEGVERFLSGETIVSAVARVWKTWRTIKLGTGIKDTDGFREALKDAGFEIGDWAKDILGKPGFKVVDQETEVELVTVSNAELGFEKGAKVSETYARAKELGLDLCPNEVGPQLRLQYKDQPKGEWLLIAMKPIADSDGDLGVFYVGRSVDGKQWLNSDYGLPDFFYGAGVRFVFIRRK